VQVSYGSGSRYVDGRKVLFAPLCGGIETTDTFYFISKKIYSVRVRGIVGVDVDQTTSSS
jgi:hypothetical protein